MIMFKIRVVVENSFEVKGWFLMRSRFRIRTKFMVWVQVQMRAQFRI